MVDTETVAPRGSWATVARIYWGVVAAIGTGAFLLSCYISVTQGCRPVSLGKLNGYHLRRHFIEEIFQASLICEPLQRCLRIGYKNLVRRHP